MGREVSEPASMTRERADVKRLLGEIDRADEMHALIERLEVTSSGV